MLKYKLVFCLVCLISACTTPKQTTFREIAPRGTYIYPSSTVLNERKQFVISGENLHSAEVMGGKSVKIEKIAIDEKGKTIKLFITVNELNDFHSEDRPGKRILQVKKLDSMEILHLKIMNEKAED